MLLTKLDPMALGGLSYLVAGAYLFSLRILPGFITKPLYDFLGLERKDFPSISLREFMLLFSIVIVGSLMAPYIFLVGLQFTTASSASLLLVSELFFTILLAYILLGERLRGIEVATLLMIAVGIVLTSIGGGLGEFYAGSFTGNIIIVLACMLWAVDNTLSRIISIRGDVIEVSALKSILGGIILTSTSIALGHYNAIVDLSQIIMIIVVGVISLGNSLLLFFASLYHIGASKTTAIFSTHTVFGVVWALVILGEKLAITQALSLSIVAIGICFIYKSHGAKIVA